MILQTTLLTQKYNFRDKLRERQRRFGAAAVEWSGALLERIAKPAALEELREAVLDSANEETGLTTLVWRAG